METEKKLDVPPGLSNHNHWNDFVNFHSKNRLVIRRILDELHRAKTAGIKKVSIKTIIGCIRWNLTVETVSNDEFKINDKYTSIYAWIISHNFPQYKSMIDLRTLRSKKNDNRNSGNSTNNN